MPNLTTAAEWAEWCVDHGHRSRGVGGLLCLVCVDAYARQQTEAALEEAAHVVEERGKDHVRSREDLIAWIVAAIRALRETGRDR